MQQEAAMLPVMDGDVVALRQRGIHRVEDGAGSLIECLSGVLWITQSGDHRDITLVGGEGFKLDRDGLAVVYGLEPARFRISGRHGAARRPTAFGSLPQTRAA
jgi:DUF2917 family protein